jgi:serine/threonine protein kinase
MAAIASMMFTPEIPLETEECVPGALLGGKYRLERQLGEGGMANVWLARNELLDLPVALKVVRPEIRGSETAARLLTEARVQANLQHPNVARVYDYGQTRSGDAFIVMELLEGYSLADWLEREGALSPVLAVQIMLPVIDALCAAHRAGVIHRDLKPDNIFISHPTTELCPKLLDFGIAKISNESNPRITGHGGVVGSPAYMAPEQARGLDGIDERVDVWAACVVLYESITGKPAFDGGNHLALMLAVIEQELEPLTAPECDGLWPILAAGLVKDPELRTGSMLTLGGQLAAWLVAQGAAEDLGGEPVHWRYAFTTRETVRSATAPSTRRQRSSRARRPIERREESARVPSERRVAHERRAADRRSSTPLAAVRRLGAMTMSPGAIRKAAAARLALAAFVGAGVLALGLSQGPLAWLAPKPQAAFALSDDDKPEPYIAQPAHEQTGLAARSRDVAPIAAASAGIAVDAPPKALLTQSVRSQPDLSQPLRHGLALPPAAAEARGAQRDSKAASSSRAHLELASISNEKSSDSAASEPRVARMPSSTAPKARNAQSAAAQQPADVLKVSPRMKSAISEPSEAELGLKNPW